jgi:hypothetical protein
MLQAIPIDGELLYLDLDSDYASGEVQLTTLTRLDND